jgi:Flp pilus assembly protein TadG
MRKRTNHERKAAAAAELAILLPFLLFLVVIAVDYARIFYFVQIIENCARQGAIFASDPQAPDANLYSSVQAAALADATNLSPQPTASSATGTDSAGNPYVSVTVTWTFNTITTYLGVSSSISLSRTVQMRTAP